MKVTTRSRPRAPLTLCAAAISVLALAAHPASAQCQYEVTAIIEGPPCWPSNFPAVLTGRGMNSHGHVVGSWQMCFEAADEAFYWTPETGLVTLPRPIGVWSAIATDINDVGQIIGSHAVSGVGRKGFLFDPQTQKFTYLEPLHDGATATFLTSLNAINNAGIAVGSRVISKPGVLPTVSNAVIWDTNTGEVIDLGVGAGPNSLAVDVNGSSEGAGWRGTGYFTADSRGIVWSAEGIIEIGVLPGMVQSSIRAINDSLDAIGRSGDGTLLVSSPILWTGGTMTKLHPPDGYDRVGAADINNALQLVGHMRVEGTNAFHPMLWQRGTFYNLRDFVINNVDIVAGGVVLTDTGWILAVGTHNRAVVLAPSDQPIADLNHDCRVDVHDLQMLLDAWGPGGPGKAGGPAAARLSRATTRQASSPADFNGDGTVDVSDLLILLANWSN